MAKQTAGGFKGRDIISIVDFSKADILHVLKTAARIEAMTDSKKATILRDRVMGSLFFEPSTRTRLSFETSMERLGGRVVGFADPKMTSGAKGESLWDTIKMVEQYVDFIVMRHPLEGSARLASEATDKPVINGGDGANQHPTQTLLDLYTIQKCQKKLEGLKVAMVGDLKYGRTVHSLATALSLFKAELFFVAPDSLKMPEHYLKMLDKAGIKYHETDRVEDVINKVDILYSTRIQKERFPDPIEYERVKNVYILKASMFRNARKNLRILHPLPRVNEISIDVDNTPYAYYFEQAGNGIPVRQALLSLVLGAIK